MFSVVITEKGGAQRRSDFEKSEVTIGRVQGNDIILPKGNVSKRHARVVLKDNRFIVVDLKSTNGTYVNGRKITSPLVVKSGDKIYIGDFILNIDDSAGADGFDGATAGSVARTGVPAQRRSRPPGRPAPPPKPSGSGFQLEKEPSEDYSPPPRVAPPSPRRPVQTQQEIEPPPLAAPPKAAPPPSRTNTAVPSGPQAPAPLSPQAPSAPLSAPLVAPPAAVATIPPSRGEIGGLGSLMMRVAGQIDIHAIDPSVLGDPAARSTAHRAIEDALAGMQRDGSLDGQDRGDLASSALSEAVGLGPIDALLATDEVREIVVERWDRLLADFGKGLEGVEGGFSSPAALLTCARRLVAQAGRVLDPGQAIVEAALPYGPHVTVVQAPVAVRGPIIEIRRTARGPSLDDLVEQGTLSPDMKSLLVLAVKKKRTVMVTGAVGAGVTTMLGAIAATTGDDERLVTVEEVPDLAISHDGVVSLSAGGPHGLDFAEVLRQATKLRADRLVVDDVQGSRALPVLMAIAARPPGSLVGLHPPDLDDAVAPLVLLAKLAGKSSEPALHELVGRSVHLIVHLAQTDEGRRVIDVTEVTGTDDGEIQTQLLFEHRDGEFVAGGDSATFS